MKILLLILLLNSDGNLEGAVSAGFPTMEACEAAQKEAPSAPPGMKLRSYCVDPKQTLI